MKIIIEAPDQLPQDIVRRQVKAMEEKLKKDVASYSKGKDTSKETTVDGDPWANPEIEIASIDTGRDDGSVNHDHYLYGSPKR